MAPKICIRIIVAATLMAVSSCGLFQSKSERTEKLLSRAEHLLYCYTDSTGTRQNVQSAYNFFHQAYLLDTLNKRALMGCGYSSFILDDYISAIRYLTRLNNISPVTEAIYYIGLSAAYLDHPDVAEYYFERYLKTDSISGYAKSIYLQRGYLRHKAKKWDDALFDYHKVIQMDSTASDVYIAMGNIYFKNQKMRAAYESFKCAFDLDSDNVYAISGMSEVLVSVNKLREGITCGNRGLVLDPHNGVLYRILGNAYYRLHNMDSFCIEVQKGAENGDSISEKEFCELCSHEKLNKGE